MIKAFLFDYDGVITAGVPDGTLSSRLSKKLDISGEMASAWVASIWAPLLRGELSEEAVWRDFEEKYGKPIVAGQRDIWFKWTELRPLPTMLDLLRRLKTKGYPLGVLTNAIASTKQAIRLNGGYAEFDIEIISSEVGFKKPDPEIFKIALEKFTSLKPNEVVFLDDREHSIVSADRLGFKTILVKDHANAITEVERLISQV